jgi:iron complex transport system permease protein
MRNNMKSSLINRLSLRFTLPNRSLKYTHFRLIILMLGILLLFSIFIGVSLGPVFIPIVDVWRIAIYKFGLTEQSNWSIGYENIVWLIRFPRVLLASVVGAGLAVVGATLQALVRNPLADSYILGISSGASVGAVLAIGLGAFAFAGSLAVQLGGFLGALVSLVIVFTIVNIKGHITPGRLILSGIGVGYVFTGITSYITLTSSNRGLAGQILSWTLGSLSRASWFDLTLPSLILLIVTIYLILQSRNINALAIGDETATTLGLNVKKFRRQLFILTALITGVMVAVSGTIGFVGLIVPHIVRLFVHSDHRRVLPISAFVGGIFLIWVDIFARTAFAPIELPVGVITAIIGGPIFLLMLIGVRHKSMDII